MDLKEIVAISGVGGLHKIIGRTKTGLILETLDASKKRFPTSIQDKVSVLEDISMYTGSGDMRLAEVFVKLNENGKAPSSKDDSKKQRQFLVEVIDLDSERVYDSDIKKLLNWFHLLKDVLDFATLLDEPAEEEQPVAETKEAKAEEATEEKPKKAAAKKTAAKKKEEGTEEEAEAKPKKTAAKKTAAKKKEDATEGEAEAKPKKTAAKKK